MFFLSSAEGARFAEIAAEMTERARRFGPNPLKSRSDVENRGAAEENEKEQGAEDQTIT